MAINDIYPKRNKKLPDSFVYDTLPQALRNQIYFIFVDFYKAANKVHGYEYAMGGFNLIRDELRREYGVMLLSGREISEANSDIGTFLLEGKDVDNVLGGIELTVRFFDNIKDFKKSPMSSDIEDEVLSGIKELNHRFKEHGIGYQYENKQIIKIESTLTHKEIIKPTLELIASNTFEWVNEEYMKAHDHFRHSRYQESITECGKAFESTMKVICSEKKWDYDQKDTASKLIRICLKNNLIPSYLQNQFTSLKKVLESGTPTIRNKSGHGKGVEKTDINEELAQYALNIGASNILYLIRSSGIN